MFVVVGTRQDLKSNKTAQWVIGGMGGETPFVHAEAVTAMEVVRGSIAHSKAMIDRGTAGEVRAWNCVRIGDAVYTYDVHPLGPAMAGP